VGIHTDRQGIGRGVRPEAGSAGRHHPLRQDGGFARGLGLGVIDFQGPHGGGERVAGEGAHHRRADLGHDLGTGVGIDAPGAPLGDPLQRPVHRDVGVVAGGKLAAERHQLGGVVAVGGLGLQHRHDPVPQPQQPGKLALLGARNFQHLIDPGSGAPGEPSAGVGEVPDEAVHLGPGQCRHTTLGVGEVPGVMGEPGAACPGHDAAHRVLQGRCHLPGRGDPKIPTVIAARGVTHCPQHLLRALLKVGVDPQTALAEVGGFGPLPVQICGALGAVPFAQHQQVGDDLGAGGALMGTVGQPHRPQQHRLLGDRPPGRRVLGVHRVPAGEHGDRAPGFGQRKGLEDEMVVHHVPRLVVHRVGESHVREGHVADDGVVGAGRGPGGGEGLRDHRGLRVQVPGDGGGHRVQFHPGHPGTLGSQPDERA